MPLDPRTVGVVVLSGGIARRLGGVDKTAVEVGGVPILARLLQSVAPAPTVVVGDPPDHPLLRAAAVPHVTWARESPPGGGPAAALGAGVASLLARADVPVVVVLAGDMPFAGTAVPRLVEALEAAPETDAALGEDATGAVQLLLGAYRTPVLAAHAAGAQAGDSVRRVLSGIAHVGVPLTGDEEVDVDDPADLVRARRATPGDGPSTPGSRRRRRPAPADGTDPALRPLRADARRNRTAILDATWPLLVKGGPRPTVPAVARAAGVSAATVYRSFPSRAELYAAAFAHGVCDQLEATVCDLAAPDLDPVDGLHVLARRQVELAGRWLHVIGDLPGWIDAFTLEYLARFEARVNEVMLRAQREGRLRPDLERDDIAGVTQLFLGGLAQPGQPVERVHRYIDLWFEAVVRTRAVAP
ncbi:NTP transferase domain-containing protein [Cellulomonas hominis]|uniref:NTP transferase domain-containing protein n=1 Tax=Cellulomonas hominis TaxID=156981 RepID=UPI001C0F4ECD|nr:NTP transferase domain-containing protein [Cellulomonas hominis]MBU5422381.1 NTP transferase domain-containing protein [Cellulomonas hominis]